MQIRSSSLLFAVTLMMFSSCESSTAPDPAREVATTPPGTAPTAAPDATPAPPPGQTSADSEDPALTRIKENFSEVNAYVNGDYVTVKANDFTCTGDVERLRLKRYFDGDKLVMLETVTGIGHHFVTTKYYFDRGELSFVYRVNDYHGPATLPEGEEVPDGGVWESTTTEERWYIGNNRTILRHLRKSYQEQSWRDNPDPDSLPNEIVAATEGTQFPHSPALEKWKNGEGKC